MVAKFIDCTTTQRTRYCQQTATQQGIHSPLFVERDFWMCWLVQQILSLTHFPNKPKLKGSLLSSKIFPLFNRNPHDIDLLVSYEDLRLPIEIDINGESSDAQQQQFIRCLFDAKSEYMKHSLAPAVSALCETTLREPWKITLSSPYQAHLVFHFPPAFPAEHYVNEELPPFFEVDIDFWHTNDELCTYPDYLLTPMLHYPDLGLTQEACTRLNAQPAERLFVDNLLLLRRYATLSDDIIRQEIHGDKFHAKTYYDLCINYQTNGIPRNFSSLFASHLQQKILFFPQKQYDSLNQAAPNALSLQPAKTMLSAIETSYKKCIRPFRGKILNFSEALKILQKFSEMAMKRPKTTDIPATIKPQRAYM